MKNQALLLADEIQLLNNPCARAAAELRRLHEANQAMLVALEMWIALANGDSETTTVADGCQMQTIEQYGTYLARLDKAKDTTLAAIAKGEAK